MLKLLRFKIISILIVAFSLSAFSHNSDSLRNAYAISTSAQKKISTLFELINYHREFTAETSAIDSLGSIAIQLAKKTGDKELILEAYNHYFERGSFAAIDIRDLSLDNVMVHAKEVHSIIRDMPPSQLKWRTLNNLAHVYKAAYNIEQSLSTAHLALVTAKKIRAVKSTTVSYITLASCYANSKLQLDAWKNYHKALEIANEQNNDTLLYLCYGELSRFYHLNKIDDQSIDYKNKQKEIVLKQQPLDSVRLMWLEFELEGIALGAENTEINTDKLDIIIYYALRTNNQRLKKDAFSLLRSDMITKDRREELYILYNKKYPDEFLELKNNRSVMFYRLKAFFCETEGKIDSALYFFDVSEKLMLQNPNKIRQANFFKRYGEFLERNGYYKEAIVKFETANKYASEVAYYEYMTDASKKIQALYAKTGDFRKAYENLQDFIRSRDSLVYFKNAQEIDRLSMQYNFAQSQLSDSLANAIEKNKIELDFEKKVGAQKTQKVIFLAAGLVFILLAALLYSRLKFVRETNTLLADKNLQIEKEKERSEDLLLNILPKNVAEELKEFGVTGAKVYNDAHILFTDFKEFTAISENLTATELIKELDTHFQMFDEIIGKYGIEKIKTIGDAYMAVGGLPEEGTCNSKCLVLAALEMQEYLKKISNTSGKAPRRIFEMRIGIHSGSVIAGVVGKKKFQYDIWGDAVNIASRMESSGEVGKVNISQSTYELIKNESDLEFTYRGRIKAKNKGELDMYFVSKKA